MGGALSAAANMHLCWAAGHRLPSQGAAVSQPSDKRMAVPKVGMGSSNSKCSAAVLPLQQPNCNWLFVVITASLQILQVPTGAGAAVGAPLKGAADSNSGA
jgi:hypothetical protein